MMEGHGKSNKAPLFQSGAIISFHDCAINQLDDMSSCDTIGIIILVFSLGDLMIILGYS